MRSGGPAGSRQIRSRTSPNGSSITCATGRRASTGWAATSRNCSARTSRRKFNARRRKMAAKPNVVTKDEPLVVERTFDAPVALVWKALTDKDDIKQWSFELREFAPVVGFEFQFDVEHEGFKYCHRCKVTEAIPNKRLAYTWRYEGYAGDSLVTFELFAQGNKTKVRLTHEGLETFPKLPAFAKANFAAGWTEIVGTSLKNFVEGRHAGEMILTRVFDAPRELMWKLWTEPEHIRKWWGPKGFTLPGCEMDFRPGGTYRFVMRGPDGLDNPFHGVYRDIVRNERIVFTAVLDNLPGHELVTTVTFAEDGGKTKLTVRQTTPPGEAGRGQNQGWSETLARRSEEHTSELQSRLHLVCRLLLEKKNALLVPFRFSSGIDLGNW